MMPVSIAGLLGRVAAAMVVSAACAQAQDVPPAAQASERSGPRWVAAVGYESFWFRDISGTGRPMKTSPIAWAGSGPVLTGGVVWMNDRRVHHIEIKGAAAGDFGYRTPLGRLATAPTDRATKVEARYQYRRYVFRKVLIDGLDLGFGGEGAAERTSFSRDIAAGPAVHDVRLDGAMAGVIAARFRRGSALGLELTWSNGLILGRRREEWDGAGAQASNSSGCGGWLTRLALEADGRLTSSARLFARFVTDGEGFISTHRAYTVGHRTILAGVTYAR